MFNLSSLMAEGNAEVGSKYYESVGMSIDLCENSQNQFKLIETPINSFLLVTNVMPNDTRPWCSYNPRGLDFNGINLPRLKKLNHMTGWNTCEKTKETAPPTDLKEPVHYIVYDTWSWQRALKLNKTDIIQEAVSHMANPKNWEGIVMEDPLPLIWLLFYGKKSFCSARECIFYEKFKHAGPVLWPPHMYKPANNVLSFMTNVCKYVKFLYGCTFKSDDLLGDEIPVSQDRFVSALDKLKFVEDCGTYVSQTCMLCALHRQNMMSLRQIDNVGGSIILGGSGKKYITSDIGTRRCLSLGDTVLFPSYNIGLLLKDLDIDGIF
ncbi:protein UL95 [Vespertilionid gammaherpesvirus 1]|uniref:Protein UL95 n=1 Tax=Vespertilionid gammaherpesvirus 1 TaxID=2560830 RepID=A0A120HQU3_9GAMA|nr:protein UL95 [Myotis gammaherpesvirus 8]AMA67389.1 protein UL95 [Vespertilionid gammaherpesvirus 1]